MKLYYLILDQLDGAKLGRTTLQEHEMHVVPSGVQICKDIGFSPSKTFSSPIGRNRLCVPTKKKEDRF